MIFWFAESVFQFEWVGWSVHSSARFNFSYLLHKSAGRLWKVGYARFFLCLITGPVHLKPPLEIAAADIEVGYLQRDGCYADD